MFLSYEQAKIRRDYVAREIAALPEGHEMLDRGRYPSIYVNDYPGRPELKHKRITSRKPEAQEILKLINRRHELIKELKDLDNFIGSPERTRKVRVPDLMGRSFYDACIEYADRNPIPKPKYAPTFKGIKFRSKSELNIAQLIDSLGYEFVYEFAFDFTDNIEGYPDFAVWVPEIGRAFILEHFGMWDKPEYSKEAKWKMDRYMEYGLLPGRDVIYTFEADIVPLDLDVVREQINALIMANTYLN